MVSDLERHVRRVVPRCVLLGALALTCVRSHAEEWDYPLSVAASASGTLFVADRELARRLAIGRRSVEAFVQRQQEVQDAFECSPVRGAGRRRQAAGWDSSTRDIFRFDDAGQPQPLTAQGQPFGQIGIPMDIAVDAEGNLLVADLELHRIVKVPKAGGNAEKVVEVNAPRGLCYDGQKQLWIISGRKLVRLAPDGKLETIVDAGVFEFPHTVVVQGDGLAYVCDGYAKAIWKIAPGQKPEKWVSGAPLVNPVGMDLLGDKWIVVDPHAKAVFEIDASGKLTKREVKPWNPEIPTPNRVRRGSPTPPKPPTAGLPIGPWNGVWPGAFWTTQQAVSESLRWRP